MSRLPEEGGSVPVQARKAIRPTMVAIAEIPVPN